MELSKDLLEFIQLLNLKKVKYLLVGGWAVALHGKPRYTKDIDLLVQISSENADKLIGVLKDFGFASLDLKREDFLSEGQIIQLGIEPNRIDLITSLPSINFEEAYGRRLNLKLKNIEVSVIHIDDLISNKEAVGRAQDIADVRSLKKIKGTL